MIKFIVKFEIIYYNKILITFLILYFLFKKSN